MNKYTFIILQYKMIKHFILFTLLLILIIFYISISKITKITKIDLVISRYNETLDWLYKIDTTNINVICYNKNIKKFNHPKVNRVIDLPNVGKCDHTYLYHIIENYDKLNDITIFAPGSCDMNEKWGQFINTYSKAIYFKKSIFQTSKHINVKNDLYDFTLDNYETANIENRNMNNEVKTQLCSIRPFGKWYESKFGKLEIKHITYKGIFAVSKNDIHKRSKCFYKELINELMTSNPESGHFIERSWIAIFNPNKECLY